MFRPRDREAVVAVRKISFDVPEGSIVTIVGPLGCGKSTILNAVSGLLPPTRGQAEVDGVVDGVRHDVGYMFARDGMMPWRTALGNVEFGLEIAASRTGARSRATGCAASGWRNSKGTIGTSYRRGCASASRWRAPSRSTRTSYDGRAVRRARQPDPIIAAGAVSVESGKATSAAVLFVTHDLHEAIFLSDVVIVFTNRPGPGEVGVPIDLPRPRLPPAELAIATDSATSTPASGAICGTRCGNSYDG